ncbi:hypothetical protein TanjilG_22301 [Lupinus angustifolius]|uniref:LOB domain-containing protein n=1 Tax=Lupinus angustifolius TaxID=3871 RepID=A0A1J7GT99_LUPAN|nr:PREDICTED: LOB domain-containing protein 40-like [Lupinus angustifolius]OIW03644.1 hypothetical protein TanjilG_22301 [Lupinus angustifolius]
MRLSCNGCRVLRKGCTPDCPIRPSLHWIKSPHSQSNATVFLAKFYGRAGLLNLLTAAEPHLRPAIFKSLLYEACGRIVNPVSGSTGLLTTGTWHLCQAAVEAVLSGAPIQKNSSDTSFDQACDIRHVGKGVKSRASEKLHEVKSDKSKFKKRSVNPKRNTDSTISELDRDSGSGVSENRSVGGSDSGFVESVELELTLGWGPMKR